MNNAPSKEWNGLKTTIKWVLIGVVAFFVILVFLTAVCGCDILAWFVRYLQKFSYLIAVIDDLIVRLLGIVLVLVGAIGFVWYQLQTIGEPNPCCKEPPKDESTNEKGAENSNEEQATEKSDDNKKLSGQWSSGVANRFWKLAGFGALLGTGGAAFFGAYTLDSLDYDAEMRFATSPASQTILARWVQVVPTKKSECKTHIPDKDVAGLSRTTSLPDCPMDFSIRAVVPVGKDCPTAKIKPRDRDQKITTEKMYARGWRSKDRVLGFRTIKVCETSVHAADRPAWIKVGSTKRIRISSGLGQEDGPQRIVILGDTGCRDNIEQRCNREKWPAAKVLRDAAKEGNPDLVVHVGDYMYASADNWEGWRTAFFDPARPLLAAAPWIMVRGNHEGCTEFDHGPNGYFLFLGDGGDKVEICKSKDWREPTRAVDISASLRLIVADTAFTRADKDGPIIKPAPKNGDSESSNTKDVPTSDINCKNLKGVKESKPAKKDKKDINACNNTAALYGEIERLVVEGKTSWLITHVPVFGLEFNKAGDRASAKLPETTAMMLAAWNALPDGHGAKSVKVILAGDRHMFQAARPLENVLPKDLLQITSGAGGVELDPAPGASDSCLSQDGQKTKNGDDSSASKIWTSFGTKWKYCTNENWGYVLAKPKPKDNEFTFTFVPVKP